MFCKNCGMELSENAATCPRCGADNLVAYPARVSVAPVTMGLPEAVASALAQDSIELLKAPSRFLGNVMDSVDNESKGMRVLIANCDEEFLREFYRGAKTGTLQSLDASAQRASVLLSDHRFIIREVAEDLSRELRDGIAAYLGLKRLEITTASMLYDVFVCCKEAEDATGQRTSESVLAERVSIALERGGCKVFYPRRALIARHPATHDSVVNSALSSSRSLLVIGSTQAHLSSGWTLGCLNTYMSSLNGMTDAVFVGVTNPNIKQLPKEYSKMRLMSFENQDAVARGLRTVVASVRQLRNTRVKAGKKESSGQETYPDSTNSVSGPIRYKSLKLNNEGKPVDAIALRVLQIGSWSVVVRFSHNERKGHERIRVNKLRLGQEALVILGDNTHVESVDCFRGTESGTSKTGIRWAPIGVANDWLSLSLRNLTSLPTEITSLELILDDSRHTLISIRQRVMISAHSESRISMSLSAGQVKAINESSDAELYLSAPDYVKLLKME